MFLMNYLCFGIVTVAVIALAFMVGWWIARTHANWNEYRRRVRAMKKKRKYR